MVGVLLRPPCYVFSNFSAIGSQGLKEASVLATSTLGAVRGIRIFRTLPILIFHVFRRVRE